MILHVVVHACYIACGRLGRWIYMCVFMYDWLYIYIYIYIYIYMIGVLLVMFYFIRICVYVTT